MDQSEVSKIHELESKLNDCFLRIYDLVNRLDAFEKKFDKLIYDLAIRK